MFLFLWTFYTQELSKPAMQTVPYAIMGIAKLDITHGCVMNTSNQAMLGMEECQSSSGLTEVRIARYCTCGLKKVLDAIIIFVGLSMKARARLTYLT
jgi:hypothetical protein